MAINRLKKYPPESAGRLIVTNVPTTNEDASVGEIEEMLIEKTVDFNTINYIYVLDEEKKLKGVVSIKEIFRSPKEEKAKKLLSKKLVTVQADTDQEQVAYLAIKNSLKAIPVVTKDNLFLGTIPSDAILKILYQETTEDLLHFGGIVDGASYDNIFKMPLKVSVKRRTPWLIVGLFGGIIAAGVISRFEEVLSKNLILVLFIPLVVYLAAAVGSQMQTFIIRDMAINPKLRFLKYLTKQASVVLVIGLIISTLLYLVSLMLYGFPRVSFVLSVALFFAVLTSLITGLIIPFLFSKLNLDPANASGPIATIIQDILSILVYFLVASLIL
jgi:magnesium transporter